MDSLDKAVPEEGWNSFIPTGQAMAMLDVCSFNIARKRCAEPLQGSH